MRFQELMPDVLHWLGITRIHRFASMSDMKCNALLAQGITIDERVPIPDDLIPKDARVEIEAKIAAGYFAGDKPRERSGRHDRAGARRMIATATAGSAQAPESSERGTAAIAALLSADAVRERCRMVHDWVAQGRSPHFTIEPERLDVVADAVAQVTREAYPDLRIPYHSRWRHFVVGGVDRWQELAAQTAGRSAGAGARRDRPRDRERAARRRRRRGVALSRRAERAHARRAPKAWRSPASRCSRPARSRPIRMCRGAATARRCKASKRQTLARHFQVTADNPLIGLDRRAALLRRLGAALAARPDLFGEACPRPGHLVDHVLARSGGRVRAADILAMLLDGLSSIWPSGMVLDGIPIGDAGRHPAVRTGDETDGIVPFHKLSQWLTYSLLEPIEAAGVEVIGIDALTALPEYRNGGLLIDHGVIRPRAPIDPAEAFEVGSELIVEWRALTVTLLDRLLMPVRERLGLGDAFKLPHLLQGGTWSAGRKIARTLRPPDGPPPIAVAADGTVF